MAKKMYKNFWAWLMWLTTVFVGIGVGGLFLNKTFETTMFLSYLPDFVHQIVGWVLIAGTVVGAIYHLFFKK